jgi:type IV pilus assembly protein PilM
LSIIGKVQRWISEPPPDHIFEITEACLAHASPRNGVQPRLQMLGERSLAASPSAPNLLKPQAYRDALARRVGTSSPRRNSAALVIPDYAARMALLDFEEFPAGEQERQALLRFRLRKSVPFHIEESQVAYSIQLQEARRIEVLAVAIAQPILSEYETLFLEAGFRVGLVTPSSVAALPLYETGADGLSLAVKMAGPVLSALLLDQRRLRLVRCLDLSAGESETTQESSDAVLDLLQQTVAYAEDQLGERVKRLLLCGFGAQTDSLGGMAEREFKIPYAAVRSRFGPAGQETAGLLGLMEQYAA